jgi:hypothetical protein
VGLESTDCIKRANQRHFVNIRFHRLALVATVLLALGSHVSAAQDLADYDYENLSFRGIGFDVGRIWPSKVAATQTYTLRFDLGYLGPGIRFIPSVGYWSSEFRDSEIARFADQLNRLPSLRDRDVVITPEELGTIEWSDLSLGADLHLVWTTNIVRTFPYLGGGLNLHLLNGQGSAVQETFVEDLLDSTTAGFALMAGIEFEPLQTLRVYGEARYTVLSDVRYPGLRVGGALMLRSRNRTPSQGMQ